MKMNSKKDPAGGTPAGKDRSIIRKSDTDLLAADTHNDSPHSPRQQIEKIHRRRVEAKVRSFQCVLRSSAERRNELADQYTQLAKKAMELGEYSTAGDLINASNELIDKSKEDCEVCKHLSSSAFIDGIVERNIHQIMDVPPSLPAISVPIAKDTERSARITITDLLKEATAQMRGSAAPPPDGKNPILIFFIVRSGSRMHDSRRPSPITNVVAKTQRVLRFLGGLSSGDGRNRIELRTTQRILNKNSKKKGWKPSLEVIKMCQLHYPLYEGIKLTMPSMFRTLTSLTCDDTGGSA